MGEVVGRSRILVRMNTHRFQNKLLRSVSYRVLLMLVPKVR
jgi:hypothetical protein